MCLDNIEASWDPRLKGPTGCKYLKGGGSLLRGSQIMDLKWESDPPKNGV